MSNSKMKILTNGILNENPVLRLVLGTMNEGVSFAILLMNLMVPYIDVLTRQDKLGIAKAKKKEGAAK